MTTRLFYVKPRDPAMLTVATLLLDFAGLVAAVVPARRAAWVDPKDGWTAKIRLPRRRPAHGFSGWIGTLRHAPLAGTCVNAPGARSGAFDHDQEPAAPVLGRPRCKSDPRDLSLQRNQKCVDKLIETTKQGRERKRGDQSERKSCDLAPNDGL